LRLGTGARLHRGTRRQQEIAGVAGLHVDDVATSTNALNVTAQEDFHSATSSETGVGSTYSRISSASTSGASALTSATAGRSLSERGARGPRSSRLPRPPRRSVTVRCV